MFAIARPTSKISNDDTCKNVSSFINDLSTSERRNTKCERRFPVERRRVFSCLFAGFDKRKKELEQRRVVASRREVDQQASPAVKSVNKLIKLNEKSIASLVKDQMLIVNKITTLLPIKKDVEFSQIENDVQEIFSDIKFLMQKEEYFLCYYLKTNKDSLTDIHIGKLLSIINTDISKLSDELMQFVEKYHSTELYQTNVGFLHLDMVTIREKLLVCLFKKKKNLYPIYIT